MQALSDVLLSKDAHAVRRLIQQGALLDAVDSYGTTPLIIATIQGQTEFIQLLLQAGASIDFPDVRGYTALFWAVADGDLALAKLLLAHGANPNVYDQGGQPLLANPKLRDEQALLALLLEHGGNIEFARDYIQMKFLGHRFELKGKANLVNDQGAFIESSYEGFTSEFTIGLIYKSLSAFSNSNVGKRFPNFMLPVQQVMEKLLLAKQLIPPVYKFRQHEHAAARQPLFLERLLIIPISYHGHAISIVRYGDYLAKCDRGVNNITDTTVIYSVKNPYLLNASLVKQLIYQHNTEQFLHHDLKALLGLENFATLPARAQITGNCSWANTEAAVLAALFMLQLPEMLHAKADTGIVSKVKQQLMHFYQAWIDWDKNRVLDEAIEILYQSTNLARRTSKAIHLANILLQACHPKHYDEVVRAKKILSILTKKEFQYILSTYTTTYAVATSKAYIPEFARLLQLCKVDLQKLTMADRYLQAAYAAYEQQHAMVTALHQAAARGDLPAVQRLLTDTDLDVDVVDISGSHALIYAAAHGHIALVRYLIEIQSSNYKIVNNQGGNALRYAMKAENAELIQYLTPFYQNLLE
jgi:ankyrin repeat protein